MRHIPITCEQREAMLRAVGVSGIDELFADIPEQARLKRPLALGGGLSEIELTAHMHALATRNRPASSLVSFAGAGCYDHYIPSVVDHVLRRPEFFTAYTPYQPEVSQGTLQAMFEYQTMMCELTGMEVANASMYDGATAFVEAALMACRVTKRSKVVCSASVHPEWLETLRTYAASGLFEIVTAGTANAPSTPAEWSACVDNDTAALLTASPDYWGAVGDAEAAAELAHGVGALCVVATNPILLGVMEPPGSCGADIVVAEGQPLGNPMSFGGPGLGVFTCRMAHVRQIPGRVVGRTVDVDGNDAFVLTLTTREQHIRREKATSNICSNHALNALAAAVYLSAVGREGLAGIARACVSKAHYLHDRLVATGRFSMPWDTPYGYEFALDYDGDAKAMHAAMLDRGYLAGVVVEPVERTDVSARVLFAVTEKRTREEIDAFVDEVEKL